MKKLIAWFLVLAMCVSMFAACGQDTTPTTAPTTEAPTQATEPSEVVDLSDPEGLAAALEYLKTIYKNAGGLTPKDFTRVGTVPIGAKRFEVVWTASVGEDLVKAVRGADGMVTIDVNEACDTETPYTLTATLTDEAGNSVSYSWEHTLPAALNVSDILDQAYALGDGESLPYEVTLTGVVTSIDTLWSDQYGNITVTITMEGEEGRPVQCYRLAGDGAKDIAVGDTITVTGTISNYKGTIEFAQGCTLDNRISGGGTAPTPVEYTRYQPFPNGQKVVIYNVKYGVALSEKKTSHYNVGVKKSSYGATEVWTAVLHSNGTYSFVNADGEAIGMGSEYSSMDLGEKYDRWEVIKLGRGKFLIRNLKRDEYFMEWYAKYNNFSTYNYHAPETDDQYIMNFILLDDDEVPAPEVPDTSLVPEAVADPKADTAYKFTLFQNGLGELLNFTGKMSGYYYETSENVADAVDVYLESATGGYHIYFMNGETKTYLNVIPRDGSAGKTNVVLQTLEQNAAPSVYTLNTEFQYVSTDCEGKTWYLGTYGTNRSISASDVSYIADTTTIGVSQFTAWFTTLVEKEETGGEGGNEGTTSGTAALMTELPVDGDTVIIYNSGNAMGKEASGSRLAGVAATVTDSKLPITDEIAQLTVTVDADGKYIFTLDGKYLTSADTGNGLSFADTLTDCGKWTMEAATDGTWYIKNVGANYNGNYNQAMEYYSGFTTYGIKTTEVYQMQLFKVGAAEESTGASLLTTAPTDGSVVVVYNSGKAMTSTPSSGRLAGVDATVTDGKLPITDEMAQLTVTVDADGKYIFTLDGKYLTSADTGNGLSFADTLTDCGKWTMEAATEGTWYIKNVGANYNGNYNQALEYYNGFTTYGIKTTDVYKMQLFEVTAGTGSGGTEGGEEGGETGGETGGEEGGETEDTTEGITITFDDKAKRTVFTTEQQVWVENGITVTNDKAASESNVGDYADPARFYKGSSVTVDCESMTKIAFNCDDYKDTYVTELVASLAAEGYEAAVDGLVVTVAFESAVDSFTVSGLTAQIRVDSITVYGPEGGESGGEEGGETGGEEGGETGGEVGETTTVTVSIADYAAANGWVNSTGYDTINMDETVKVTATGTPTGDWGLNTGKFYTNGNNWRIYQNESPALTVSAEGKTIVSVKITYASQNTGVLTLNGENVESDAVVTVNASSVTFSVGNTATATNGQARITAIEVVYG